MNFCDIVGLNHSVRAIEVALVGQHSLGLYGAPNTGKATLVAAALGMVATVNPAEQHQWFIAETPKALTDIESRNHLDIWCDVVPPRTGIAPGPMQKYVEGSSAKWERIQRGRNIAMTRHGCLFGEIPDWAIDRIIEHLSEDSRNLLKNGEIRMQMSKASIRSSVRVAMSCGALDDKPSPIIRQYHIAEALQYKSLPYFHEDL